MGQKQKVGLTQYEYISSKKKLEHFRGTIFLLPEQIIIVSPYII